MKTIRNIQISQKNRGFSLVELLVVIAVIGLIAGIAIPSVSKVTDKAKTATAQKNAQTICSLHSSARSAGAGFVSTTRGGIIGELVIGVTGTIVDSSFQMSALSDVDKTEVLKYCAYDGGSDTMNYYPDGNAPEDTDEHEWEVYGYIWDSSEIAYWNSIQLDGYEYRAGVSVLEDLSAILVERRKL